jgi:hypothetical protein
MRRVCSGFVGILAVLGASFLVPAAAGAAGGGCGATVTSQPFATWGDSRDYALAPGGSFEDGAAGWDLSGGAALSGGGFGGSGAALHLPAGSSATSAPVCVSSGDSVSRMFASGDGKLGVEVLGGGSGSHSVGTLHGDSGWSPTRQFSTGGGVGSDGASVVRYRFTADSGDLLVDDLYVDPRAKH